MLKKKIYLPKFALSAKDLSRGEKNGKIAGQKSNIVAKDVEQRNNSNDFTIKKNTPINPWRPAQ
jgi:hypothetical protein